MLPAIKNRSPHDNGPNKTTTFSCTRDTPTSGTTKRGYRTAMYARVVAQELFVKRLTKIYLAKFQLYLVASDKIEDYKTM